MDDASPTLLLTRPDAQSRAFLAECEGVLERRVPAVVAPVIRIVEVGNIPDLDQFATIAVTSSHAVRRLADEGALRGRRVACVGEMTARLAREFGAEVVSLGADVSSFLERSEAIIGPCLYVRGRHVRLDLVAALEERGVMSEDVIVYDQIAQPLSRAGEALLFGASPVVAPLFSARTAELLGKTLGIRAPLTVIAISETVASAWIGGGDVRIVTEPSSAAMCAAVVRCF